MLHHANIAPLYGVDYQLGGAPAIVLPWYKNGSADVYLRQHPDAKPMKTVRALISIRRFPADSFLDPGGGRRYRAYA
jgi:hypothetical protein